MSAGYDGSIKIDTSINSSGFNKGVKGMMTSLKSLAIAIGIAFSVGAVIAFGQASVNAASEIQSAFIGLQSIVEGQGKSFSGAKDYINDYIADGLVPAANAVTAYKNLLMRGYSTDQIETVMGALKNSAAFGRQQSLSMGQAVQSASEGLKNENSILVDNAGVTKNVSMMWKDYALSIGTTVNALTKEQKIEAEVQGILQETRFQMGDAAKLAQTYGGRMSALGVSFTNLKVAIGNSIIPVINQVVPYIKAAIDALTVFFNQVALIMNALFGSNVSMASVASGLETASGGMSEVADSSQAASDAQGDLAKNTAKAGKAAKGALAAFDQLNVLQQDTDSDSGSGSASSPSIPSGVGGGLDIPVGMDAGLSALQERVAAFKAQFLTFIQPVTDALGRLKESLLPLGMTIWAGLKWAWDNILVPLGSWAITDLLPAFLDLLGGSAEVLDSILIALQPIWMWFWENVLRPLAEWTGGVIVDFLGSLADGLKGLSDWIDAHQEGVRNVTLVITGLAIALWLLNGAVGAVNILIGIYNTVAFAMAGITWAALAPILAIILLIVGLAVVIYLLITRWDQLSTTVKQIGFLISFYVTQAATSVRESFFAALDAVKAKFETIFTGIKSFVKGIINSIIDILNGMLTASLSGFNNLINGANTIGGVLPGFAAIPVLTAPQIPHLASGAVIPPNAEFAAILGDQRNGRNLEAPEGLIRQIIREEIGSIKGEFTFDFEGSLGALVRELRPVLAKENIRFGGSLAKGAA